MSEPVTTPAPASAAAPAPSSVPAPAAAPVTPSSPEAPKVAPSVLGAQPPASGQGQGDATAPAPTSAPVEPLEIKLPEGVSVDQKMLDGFKAVAKDAGLNSETATKVAAWYAEQMKLAGEATAKDIEAKLLAEQVEHEKALKADPAFGGAQFEANAQVARKAVLRFGGEALASLIDQYGLGNNPVLAKTFLAIGKAMAEDSTVAPAERGGPVKSVDKNAQWAKALYGIELK